MNLNQGAARHENLIHRTLCPQPDPGSSIQPDQKPGRPRAPGHRDDTLVQPDEQAAIADLKSAVEDIEAVNIPRWRSFYNCLLALPRSVPLQAVYSWDPGFANRMAELIHPAAPGERFDLVHVEHLRGVNYGLHLQNLNGQRAQFPPVPIVWDSVDCISYLFEQSSQTSTNPFSRWLTRFELSRTRPYEAALLDKFNRVLVTSKIDREAFYSLAPENLGRKAISVLPNGVNLDYFVPPEAGQRASRHAGDQWENELPRECHHDPAFYAGNLPPDPGR